jgi:hypothetical protein
MKLSGKKIIDRYIFYCLQGDVCGGYQFLCEIKDPPQVVLKFRQRLKKRLFSDSPQLRFKSSASIWVRQLLRIFADYYVAVLVRKQDIKRAEELLAERVKAEILNCAATMENSLEEQVSGIDEKLKDKFRQMGWYYLGGRTLPFVGPYIYEEQEGLVYKVELPLGERELTINFMKKVHSRSWLDFITLSRSGTGGWAKDDGLYCFADFYDVDSSNFRINYLKHEAQHFDDYERFPFLNTGHSQDTLEFRAKLVELIYAENTVSFQSFMAEASENKEIPHSYAAYRLREALRERLNLTPDYDMANYADMEKIRQEALNIFQQNTRELESFAQKQD